MVDYLKSRPMLIAALGCILVSLFAFYSKPFFIVFVIAAIICLVVAVLSKKVATVIVVTLIIIMQIACCVSFGKIDFQNRLVGKTVQADIVFTDIVYKSGSYCAAEAEVLNSRALERGSKLMVWYEPSTFSQGSILSVEIKLSQVNENRKASCYSKGIYLTGSIRKIKPTGSTDFVMNTAGRVRQYVRRVFFKNLDYNSAATMSALMIGDKDYFTDEFYSNVKSAGVAHVMVVSGMHLSIMVALILWICEKFVYNRFFRAFVMFAVVAALCAICGFTMSILRAGVTYIIMAVGLFLNRPYSGDNALGAAVCFILIGSPFAVFDVAFLLSVLSTFGILAVAIPICKALELPKCTAGKFVLQTAIISLSALLLTLPVSIFVFGYISTVGVVTNLLISLPVTFCMSIASVAVVLNLFCPVAAKPLFYILEIAVKYVNSVINYFGSRNYSVLRLSDGFGFVAILLIAILFWIMLSCKRKADMLKLKEMNNKVVSERGSMRQWRLFLKRR